MSTNKIINDALQLIGGWQPGVDDVFLVNNRQSTNDGRCNFVYLCLESCLPGHVIARPMLTDGRALPVVLPRARYQFTEGSAAIKAMGLTDAVASEIKQRHSTLRTSLDS